jgi:hypothetical protein
VSKALSCVGDYKLHADAFGSFRYDIHIFTLGNNLGDEDAKSVADCLRTNMSLVSVKLGRMN